MDINIPPHVDIDGTKEDENTADRDMTLCSMGVVTEIEIETNNEVDSSSDELRMNSENNEPAFDAEEDDVQSDPMFLIQGFIGGCRPIIGLDACFLKGPFGGQLMAAIGKDGNNQMFPLTVAVVQCEYRQKGLVETLHQLLPSAHLDFVSDIYANFKLRFKDKELKDLMWAAARSFLEDGYNDNLNQINVINTEAYQWVKQIPPKLWCKFKMSNKPKCDMLSNNLSESFNNYIKESREEPILSILEMLRRQFMCRFQKKRDWIAKYSGRWEILSGSNSFVSSLQHHTCRYREWQLTGIPCVHATCAILIEHNSPEDFVVVATKRSIGHTDAGRGRGTTTNVVGGRKVVAGASQGTKTTVDSVAAGRGRGRDRGRGRGPLSGIGKWNGIGMSTMQHFIPATEGMMPSL
ncbi:hypothetical protein Sango_1256100 [Sesamum angolense]|uniref:Zinc finger PMZ-type domain-containing protein n=1 Tax=Sesamum angolense TaxID=2727404 RepID=A0AAE2BU34_9LAMI|nr:hypothetical protein Sango_1256100 [Sesamum angolense]